jgi:hypothetical protein
VSSHSSGERKHRSRWWWALLAVPVLLVIASAHQVRTARSVVDDTTETSAIYGHSQCAHAVLYAAELAPSYAPELDLVGAAAMAPPTNLGDLANRNVNEPLGIILTSLAVTSWSTLYPDKVDVATIVHEEARPPVAGIGDRCIGTIGDGTGQAVADLPEVAALEARLLSADPSTAPGWSTMLDDNSASGVTIEVLAARIGCRAIRCPRAAPVPPRDVK